ncbi:Hypothetical protein NTJ_10929 [Nesidiocoris tenuis]|nr:Hypothetical protein NTJ_10929 [Nesidiocoris tenuis]
MKAALNPGLGPLECRVPRRAGDRGILSSRGMRVEKKERMKGLERGTKKKDGRRRQALPGNLRPDQPLRSVGRHSVRSAALGTHTCTYTRPLSVGPVRLAYAPSPSHQLAAGPLSPS